MRFAPDDDMIETLTPDRSDQPFGEAVLPGRGWCGRLVPDTHGTQSACDDGTIDPIAVPDHVARSLVPRECPRYLTCNPFRRRICCDVDPDHITTRPEYCAWSRRRCRASARRACCCNLCSGLTSCSGSSTRCACVPRSRHRQRHHAADPPTLGGIAP